MHLKVHSIQSIKLQMLLSYKPLISQLISRRLAYKHPVMVVNIDILYKLIPNIIHCWD